MSRIATETSELESFLAGTARGASAAIGKDDYREYHQRAAARLRSLAEHSTTKAIKARLIAEAEEHERIARGGTESWLRSPPISPPPSDKPQEKRKRHHRNQSLSVLFEPVKASETGLSRPPDP